MTPAPFGHLGFLYGPFRLGKLLSCACSLSHATSVGILGLLMFKV